MGPSAWSYCRVLRGSGFEVPLYVRSDLAAGHLNVVGVLALKTVSRCIRGPRS
jgi:hypothetical protein